MHVSSLFQDADNNNYDLKRARKSSTFYVIRYRHKLCEEERIRCSLAIMRTDALITIDGQIALDTDRSIDLGTSHSRRCQFNITSVWQVVVQHQQLRAYKERRSVVESMASE
jgi:hypothetical protein